MENEIMTIEEVARHLRVSERTVYEWAQRGEIPGGKLGTSWRFKRSEINRWIDDKLLPKKGLYSAPVVSLLNVLTPQRCAIINKNVKKEVLEELIQILSQAPEVHNPKELSEAIFRREELMSTGIGLSIGLPHVRIPSVSDIVMAFGVTKGPINDYESLDGEPVRIIAMIAASQGQHTEHVRLLSQISAQLKDIETREALIKTKEAGNLYEILIHGIKTTQNSKG